MKDVRTVVLMAMLVLGMASQKGFSLTEFNSGTHNVDYRIYDNVIVDCGAVPGVPTIVNFTGNTGGMFYPYMLQAFQDSQINIINNFSLNSLSANGNSKVIVDTGSVSNLYANDNSQITIKNTAVSCLLTSDNSQTILHGSAGVVTTMGDSQLIFDGLGEYINSLTVCDNSNVTLSSYYAYVFGDFEARHTSQTTIFAGILMGAFGEAHIRDNAVVKLVGSNFYVDGSVPFEYGEITSTFNGHVSGDVINITARAASGEYFGYNFTLYDDAKIVLIPEPATLALLVLGGLALSRRKK